MDARVDVGLDRRLLLLLGIAVAVVAVVVVADLVTSARAVADTHPAVRTP